MAGLCVHGRTGSGDGVAAPVWSIGEVETALVRCTRCLVDGFLSLPPHDEGQNPLARDFHYCVRDGRVIHFDADSGDALIVPPCSFAQVRASVRLPHRRLSHRKCSHVTHIHIHISHISHITHTIDSPRSPPLSRRSPSP